MWSRKGGLLIFFGVISIFIGLIIGDFQFLVLALITFIFFLLVFTLPKPEIDIDREVSNPLMFENNESKVHLKIKKVRGGFGTVEVYDRIPEYSALKEGINNNVLQS